MFNTLQLSLLSKLRFESCCYIYRTIRNILNISISQWNIDWTDVKHFIKNKKPFCWIFHSKKRFCSSSNGMIQKVIFQYVKLVDLLNEFVWINEMKPKFQHPKRRLKMKFGIKLKRKGDKFFVKHCNKKVTNAESRLFINHKGFGFLL